MSIPPGKGLARTQKRNKRRRVLKTALNALPTKVSTSDTDENHIPQNEPATYDYANDNRPRSEPAWHDNVAFIHIECCSDYEGSPPPEPYIPPRWKAERNGAALPESPHKRIVDEEIREESTLRKHIRFAEDGVGILEVEYLPAESFGHRQKVSWRPSRLDRPIELDHNVEQQEWEVEEIGVNQLNVGFDQEQAFQDTSVEEGEDESDEVDKDIPPLAPDPSSLPSLSTDAIQADDIITFQRLQLVSGMPTMTPHIVGRVVSVDDSFVSLIVPRSYRRMLAEGNDQSSFGRFEITENAESEEEHFRDRVAGQVEIAISELMDTRLVKRAESTEMIALFEPRVADQSDELISQDVSRHVEREIERVGDEKEPKLSKSARRRRNLHLARSEADKLDGMSGNWIDGTRKGYRNRDKKVDGVADFLKYLRPGA